jgi:TPR repeat protein
VVLNQVSSICTAAAQMDPDAADIQHILGRAHQELGDYDRAFCRYREAARGGFVMAFNNLATLYSKGQGTDPDDDMAVDLYRIAIGHGSSLAEHNLAFHYFQGRGVAKDVALGRRLLEAAAAAGVTASQRRLASIDSDPPRQPPSGRGLPGVPARPHLGEDEILEQWRADRRCQLLLS